MELNLTEMLKSISKGYHKIVQVRKDGGIRTLKNDNNHLHTFSVILERVI
ncbi:hypothetical protein [Orenia metallireducens]|nr:hypothetical protein [Orenia metallireducens]